MNPVIFPNPFVLQARYFKALAHPVRLQILAILGQGEACVCHLEAFLQKRQAYISQQLMVLKEAGLLTERKEGLFVFYSLVDPNLATIIKSSLTFLRRQTGDSRFGEMAMVEKNNHCVCPICSKEKELNTL